MRSYMQPLLMNFRSENPDITLTLDCSKKRQILYKVRSQLNQS